MLFIFNKEFWLFIIFLNLYSHWTISKYFFFLVSKEKDTVGIIYYDDEIPFRKGDTIALQWKMDSIDIAGEGILSFEEWYVSGKKIGHKTKK